MGKNTDKDPFSFEDDPGALDDNSVDFTFSDIPVLGKSKVDPNIFDTSSVSGKGGVDPGVASLEAMLTADGAAAPDDSDMSPQDMAVSATNMSVDIHKVRSAKMAKKRKKRMVALFVMGGAGLTLLVLLSVGALLFLKSKYCTSILIHL